MEKVVQGVERSDHCTACFSGKYPIPIADQQKFEHAELFILAEFRHASVYFLSFGLKSESESESKQTRQQKSSTFYG